MAAPKQTYVYLGAISALREYYTTFKNDCSRGEKHTLNQLDSSLRRVENIFRRQGLIDNPEYDRMVSIIVDALCALDERIDDVE